MNFMKILTFIFVILSINYTNAEDLEPESLLQLRKLLQLNKNYYNNCPNREKEWMTRCDTDAADDWDIEGEQDYSSRKYCCYTWDKMSCILKIARKCDSNYANQLERDYEQQFNSICYYHSRRSASCALRWWSIMLIVIGGLLIIGVIAFFVYRRRQNKYNSKYDY